MKEICDMINGEFVWQTYYAWRNTSTLIDTEQNGPNFAENISKCIFLEEEFY